MTASLLNFPEPIRRPPLQGNDLLARETVRVLFAHNRAMANARQKLDKAALDIWSDWPDALGCFDAMVAAEGLEKAFWTLMEMPAEFGRLRLRRGSPATAKRLAKEFAGPQLLSALFSHMSELREIFGK